MAKRSVQDARTLDRKMRTVKRINERIAALYRVNPNAREIEQAMEKVEAKLGANFITRGVFSGAPKITADVVNVSLMNEYALEQLDRSIPQASTIFKRYEALFKEDAALQEEGKLTKAPDFSKWPKLADLKKLAVFKIFWSYVNSIERRLERFLQDTRYEENEESTFWSEFGDKTPTWAEIDKKLKEKGF